MGVAIRINDAIYNEAKQVARAEHRSVPHQLEYWARLGKCGLDNPDLSIDFIKDILVAKNSDPALAEVFHFEHDRD